MVKNNTEEEGRTGKDLVALIGGIKHIGDNHRGIALADTVFYSRQKYPLSSSFKFYKLLDQASQAIDDNRDPSETIAEMKKYDGVDGDSVVGQPKLITESIEVKYEEMQGAVSR